MTVPSPTVHHVANRRRRTVHDFTVRDDLTCPVCGYLLRGLPATRRCPECGELIVEAIRVDRLGAERGRGGPWWFDSTSFAGWTGSTAMRGEWRAAPWLALIGLGCGAARLLIEMALSAWRLTMRSPSVFAREWLGGPGLLMMVALLAVLSALVSYVGLCIAERLGFAGFASRRAVAALVAMLHLFALGVATLLPQPAQVLAPVLATAPLAWLLADNAPDRTPVLQIVGVLQAIVTMACLMALLAMT